MKSGLFNFEATVKAITDGQYLIISADDSFLARLPKGNWIGGTSPYSMSNSGGAYLTTEAYLQELPSFITSVRTQLYNKENINLIYKDGFESGFSVILLPAFSEILVKFAMHNPEFSQFGVRPLIGWITGTKLEDLGTVPAKVYNGFTNAHSTDEAVVMHVQLPNHKYADIGIINIFETADHGDRLTFESDSLEVENVWVNNQKVNFADYLIKNKVDLRWPLVGEYNGAMINSSFLSIDEIKKTVKLFAPIFSNVSYCLAKPAGNYSEYLEAFRRKMSIYPKDKVVITCNCMFNYKYGDLDGRKLDELTGPFVFGEVAYQILNQTLVYLTVDDVKK